MPRFQHFVITRFSIRPTMTSTDRLTLGPNVVSRGVYDPLAPEMLERRFHVFEIACLPGVLAQTDPTFTWVIVVDRDLSEEWRARLNALVAARPHTVIHDYDPEQSLGEIAWLEPYVETPTPDYLLTTNLDDDDALPPRFVESLRAIIEERGDRLAPLEVFGATQLWEWDLDVSADAPLGYRAPWHRDFIEVASVGFTLLARYPAYPLTVMRVPHGSGSNVLNWSAPPLNPAVAEARQAIQAGAAAAGDSLADFDPSETFHPWVDQVGWPLMTNHQINLQGLRLYESKERIAVTGMETFPNAVIDWDAFQRYAQDFQVSRRMRAQYYFVRTRRAVRRLRRKARRLRRVPARLRRHVRGR